MSNSVRLLLADCIDYAGIFPPARLSPADALHNFVQYTRQPEAWMLGRFVCPASLLPGLSALATDLPFLARRGRLTKGQAEDVRQIVADQLGVESSKLPNTLPNIFREFGADSLDAAELVLELEDRLNMSISDDPERSRKLVSSLTSVRKNRKHSVAVVGTSVACQRDACKCLEQDVQALLAFLRTSGEHMRVDALEMKVPPDAVDPPCSRLCDLVKEIQQTIGAAGLRPLELFFEIPLGPQWKHGVGGIIDHLAQCRDEHVGLKIRTGAADGQAAPGADQVAWFITVCRKANVAWKATAGLHSPLPRQDSSDHGCQYGFLNVIAAAVLSTTHELECSQIVPILEESSVNSFSFNDTAFAWRDLAATGIQIEHARHASMRSFGSCSFDEPRDGLRELMLIP